MQNGQLAPGARDLLRQPRARATSPLLFDMMSMTLFTLPRWPWVSPCPGG